MRDGELDEVLNRAAGASPDVDPALLDRISQSIGASIQPVRPLPPWWVLAVAATIGCMATAAAGGVILGLHGVKLLSTAETGVIFPSLGILIWLAAAYSSREMIPGIGRPVPAWAMPLAASVVLAVIFAALFRDYRTERFVAQGIACLTAGALQAIPAGVLGWLILRRGFAVDPWAAGLAQGTLAGMAGVSMLELHCANFETPHVIVWHIAVLPVCVAAAVLLVRALAWGRRAT